MEAGRGLVDAAADADGANAIADGAEVSPLAGDGDAVGAGAVERELDAHGGSVDAAGAGAFLRRDVADERPEFEGGADGHRRVAESAADAGCAPCVELAA